MVKVSPSRIEAIGPTISSAKAGEAAKSRIARRSW
jgi:hypothetical protein